MDLCGKNKREYRCGAGDCGIVELWNCGLEADVKCPVKDRYMAFLVRQLISPVFRTEALTLHAATLRGALIGCFAPALRLQST